MGSELFFASGLRIGSHLFICDFRLGLERNPECGKELRLQTSSTFERHLIGDPVAVFDINSAPPSLVFGLLIFLLSPKAQEGRQDFPTSLVESCDHVTKFWPMKGK